MCYYYKQSASAVPHVYTERRVNNFKIGLSCQHFDWMLQSSSGWKVGKVFRSQTQSWYQRTFLSIYAGASWEQQLCTPCVFLAPPSPPWREAWYSPSLMPRQTSARVHERVWLHKSKFVGSLQNLKATNEIVKRCLLE